MRVGAIIFDPNNKIFATDRNIVSLGNAWASIKGGQARRIQTVHELPTDVIWITSLHDTDFYRAGLQRHPNFRNSGWLRSQLHQIAAELGVDMHNAPPDVTASTIAAVAHRTVDIARSRYGVDIKGNRLNDDFGVALGAPRSNLPDNHYPNFEQSAKHTTVTVIHTTNYNATANTVTVRRNRLRHAVEIMDTPVPPDTGWEHEKSLGKDRTDHWLESVTTPFMVQCSIKNIDPMIAEILSWGSGAKNVREWLTDIEWRVVREHGDITVKSALICREPATRLSQASLLPNEPLAELSFTYGLIAEQIWTSLTSLQPYKTGATRYTAAAAWLRAADRMIMFDYAQKLYARNLNVGSYGVGNIVLKYPEGGLRRTLDISTDLGLMPPTSKFMEAAEGAVA